MTQSTSEWQAGFAAGAAGEPGRCPARAGSIAAWSWHSGYVEGAAQRMIERRNS
jgi:hypothetical protein